MKLFTKTNKRTILIILFFVSLSLLALLGALVVSNTGDAVVLNPKGQIASKEKDLLVFATVLSLVVIIPVYSLLFFIVFKYRAGNNKAKYRPDWNSSRLLESIWWGVPLVLITILSVVTWKSSHELDPFKPLQSELKPIKIQVVSMNWKWLFIYPEENIATVNYVKFPVDTAVDFQITGDSAMNSFWIPQLGGQIYAMPGMSTRLHLEAEEPGIYRGSSANISGQGFSDMKFMASAVSDEDFRAWVKKVKRSPHKLNSYQYEKLSVATNNHPQTYYRSVKDDLYNDVMRKYLEP